MENNYMIKVKTKTRNGVFLFRIIIMILFLITGIITFFYSIRYFLYIVIFMLLLLFRLKIKEKDSIKYVDALCKLSLRERSINLVLDSDYRIVCQTYNIEYKNIEFFNINNDGKIMIGYKKDGTSAYKILEMYIECDDIDDWVHLKTDIENYKINIEDFSK